MSAEEPTDKEILDFLWENLLQCRHGGPYIDSRNVISVFRSPCKDIEGSRLSYRTATLKEAALMAMKGEHQPWEADEHIK